MTTFLFWNMNNKSLHENIARMVQIYHVDVVMLAEYPEKTTPGDLLLLLSGYNYLPSKKCKRIWLFTRFNVANMTIVYEHDRYVVRHLTLPGLPSILIVMSHLWSKNNRSQNDQAQKMPLFAQKIRELEQQIGHTYTILVGDFNMSPFEDGVTHVEGLNATLSLAQAQKGGRESGHNLYPYFYNPMWNLFGDFTPGPPGTYYYNTSFNSWHMFDQVMLRPELLDRFDISKLHILNTDGEISLLSKQGLPKLSDHLPILFTLEL